MNYTLFVSSTIWLRNAVAGFSLLLATALSVHAQDVSLELAWDDLLNTNAVAYRLYVTNTAGQGARVDAGTNLQFAVEGLEPAVTYHFSVTAYSELDIESELSETIVWTIPTVVQTLMGDSYVRLTWLPCLDALGYVIKRASNPGGPYQVVMNNPAPASTWVDEGVLNGATYYYKISILTEQGESRDSAVVRGEAEAGPPNLNAQRSGTTVVLSWNQVAESSSYVIKRALVSGGPYSAVGEVSAPGFVDSTVAKGRAYFYVVSAKGSGGTESGHSTEAGVVMPPSAPVSLEASLLAATVIQLNWSCDEPLIDDFLVEWSDNGAPFALLESVAGSARTFLATELTGGADYAFRVRARNAGGTSDPSTPSSVSTPEFGLNVNFGPEPILSSLPDVAGYLQDYGEPFGLRNNGLRYGWSTNMTAAAVSRESPLSPDARYDSFIVLGTGTSGSQKVWEIEIPNGFYAVHVVAGDPFTTDVPAQFVVEGGLTPLRSPSGARWLQFTNTIGVQDGRVTISASPQTFDNKLCFVDIYNTVPVAPRIGTHPQDATVAQNSRLLLSASVAQGSEPLSIQWYRDGVPVPNARELIFDVRYAQRRDAGSYMMVLSNLVGSVTSQVARVVIIPSDFPPTISTISSRTIGEDGRGTSSFRVGDADSPASTIQVRAYSSNQGLLPDGNILITGTETNRNLTLTPAHNQWGEVTITVVATDLEGHAVTNAMTLTVTSINDPPTLDPISSISVPVSSGQRTINLTGIGSGAANESDQVVLSVSAAPSGLLSQLSVEPGLTATTATLKFTPAPNVIGAVIITVLADDQQSSSNLTRRSFTLNIVPPGQKPSVYIEAESGDLVSPIRSSTHPTATNRRYIVTHTANQGSASFQFEVPTDGIWFVWCRVLSIDDGTDSYLVSADLGTETFYDTIRDSIPGNSWQWTLLNTRGTAGPRAFAWSAGTHTLRFRGRESNTYLDALFLTTNQTLVPSIGLPNSAPTINPISDLTIPEDAGPQAILLSGLAPGSLDEDQEMEILVGTDDESLLADIYVMYVNPDTEGLLIFETIKDAYGTARFTLVADDHAVTDSETRREFTLTVLPSNDPPQVVAPSNHVTVTQGGRAIIPLTVIDPDNPPAPPLLTTSSSNPALVPPGGLVLRAGAPTQFELEINPAPGQAGTTTIRVQARDELGTTGDMALLVTVVPVQGLTLSAIADVTLNEGQEVTVPITITDTQIPDGPWVLAAESDNPLLLGSSELRLAGAGRQRTLTIAPRINQVGNARVTLTVLNNLVTANTRTFRVTVKAPETPPTITSLPELTLDEDSPTGPLTFVVYDRNSADELLTTTATSSNLELVDASGILLLGQGATRTLTLTPKPNKFGTTLIRLTVADDSGRSTQTSFTLNVRPVNDPPTLEEPTNHIMEQDAEPLVIPLTGISAGPGESQTLSVRATSSNPGLIPHPTVTYTSPNPTGSLTVRPLAGANGEATISVTVDDGQSRSNTVTKTFSVTVTAATVALSLLPIPDKQTVEDTPLTIPVTAGELEEMPLSLTLTGESDNQDLLANTNIVAAGLGNFWTLTLQPSSNRVGTARVTVTLRSDTLSSSTTFRLSVLATNDRPSLNPLADFLTNSSSASATYTIPLTGISPGPLDEQQNLTITATSSNVTLLPNPTVTYSSPANNGTLTLRPVANRTGSSLVSVKVSDNGNPAQEFTRTFLVLIQSSANALPTISTLADQTILEGSTLGPLDFRVTDAETSASSLLVIPFSSDQTLVPDQNLTLSGTGTNRNLTVRPVPNRSGHSTITLRVQDGAFGMRSVAFLLTVIPVNNPPTISAINNQVLAEDTSSLTLAFQVADVDSPLLSLTVIAQSDNPELFPDSNLLLDGTGPQRSLRLVPMPNRFGTATISLHVTDGATTTTTSFSVTVTPVNDAPWLFNLRDQVTLEDTPSAPQLFQVSDLESPDLEVTAVSSDPALLPLSGIEFGGEGSFRSLTLTPAPEKNGTALVTVTASDGLISTRGTFLLTVLPVNDPPTLAPLPDVQINTGAPQQTIRLDGLSSGDLNEEQPLMITATSSNPSLIPHPSVQWVTSNRVANLLFTPVAGASGTAAITVVVNDGQAQNNVISRTFNVQVSSGPSITPIATQFTLEDEPINPFNLGLSNPGGTVSSLLLRVSSSDSTLINNAGLTFGGSGANRTLRLTPRTNAFGWAWITLVASNVTGTATSSTFLLVVQPVDDAPTLNVLGDFTAASDTPVTVPLNGITAGAANEQQQHLFLFATSSDPSVIPNPIITYQSPNSTGSLTFTPHSSVPTWVTITVTIFDDGLTSTGGNNQIVRHFTVAVVPPAPPAELRLDVQGDSGLLSWPAAVSAQYRVYSTTNFGAAWLRLPNSGATVGNYIFVPISLNEPARLFRLCTDCGN